MNKSMHCRAGQTLLELLIAFTIFAFIASVVINQFSAMQIGQDRRQFINKLNTLVQFAWQQAVLTKKVHRLFFDVQNKKASVEVERESPDAKKVNFVSIKDAYIATHMNIPAAIEIKQFIIEGVDEMRRFAGRKTETLWFYIIPDGMTQAVIINFFDKEQLVDGKPKQTGLVLNPFTAQFKVYDAFQK